MLNSQVAKQIVVPQALAKQLDDERLREQGSLDAEPSGSGLPDQQSLQSEDGVKLTLLVAPAECYSHRTCPEPITRSGEEPPPENVNRLKVLTHPGKPPTATFNTCHAWNGHAVNVNCTATCWYKLAAIHTATMGMLLLS